MYDVQILACLMWIAVQKGSPFGSLGSLRSLASVHVESTCEISSILSLVTDSPNHPTCPPDRARRLPDMSPIRHQDPPPSNNVHCTFRTLTGAVLTQSERSEPGEAKRARLDWNSHNIQKPTHKTWKRLHIRENKTTHNTRYHLHRKCTIGGG